MSRHSRKDKDSSSDSTSGFVFYDPYYEELLRRKRSYDSQDKAESIKKPGSPKQTSLKSVAVPNIRQLSPTSNGGSVDPGPSLAAERDVNGRIFELTAQLSSKDAELRATRLKLEQCERVIRSLYADLDRQKALLTESMDRETRAARALVEARRQGTSDHVPVQEFKDMESRFQNAVKIIDDLNLKLYQFTNHA